MLQVAVVWVLALALAACSGGEGDQQRAGTTTKTGRDAAAPGTSTGASASGAGSEDEAGVRTEVRAFAAELTVAQQAGQLVMTALPDERRLSDATARQLTSNHFGGIILFGFNYESPRQMAALTAALQRAGRAGGRGAGLLISVDQEGGGARHLPGLGPAQWPSAMGRTMGEEAIERAGASSARELATIGFNVNLAPVADLDSGPRHTMAGRAFGSDPDRVASQVAAFVRGTQSAGVAATAKHFPGFGASTVNSDLGVAHVRRSDAQLDAHELIPFRAAAEQGVQLIMVSHGIFPAHGDLPASVTPSIVDGMLREQMAYEGVVITDSLNARGFRESIPYTVPQACPAAIAAGVDIALLTGSIETARLCRQRIMEAVESGDLPRERFDEAVENVLALKLELGLLPG